MCDDIELEMDSNFTDKEKQIVVRDLEQKLLEEKSDVPTYPLLDITKAAKEQELGLGLYLQGGMSVILEVDIPYWLGQCKTLIMKPLHQLIILLCRTKMRKLVF